jgi:hypothetical protein
MAFPNVSDIVASTIESRSGVVADNVTKNNALFARLKQKGKIKKVTGGSKIYQELSFAENGNAGWYSGYDLLPVAAQDVLTAAEFAFKQLAAAVVISGLEKLQNSGKEAVLDLIEQRVEVAESTMDNLMSAGVYSDGTGSGGKQLTGLAAAILATPTTGTYGGIDRASWTFWRNQVSATGALTAANVQARMNGLWAKCTRGKDRPDLIIFDNACWETYLASLQLLQRFTGTEVGQLGFPSIKFMDADVVLDGGIGGYQATNVGFFLNTNYLFLRPHADRNMVPISPGTRQSTNQDAEVQLIGWAGNITSNGLQFQGYFSGS